MSELVRQPGETVLEFARRKLQATTGQTPGVVQRESAPPVAVTSRQENEFDDDLIPDPGSDRTEDQRSMDEVLDRIGIIEAYNRWCGKSVPNPGNRRDGILVSCPNPAHPDANPSASLNLDKNVGKCFPCELGFDKYDIAAWHFDFDVPGYKSKEAFPNLRRLMAEDLGWTVVEGKDEWLIRATADQPDERDDSHEEPAVHQEPEAASNTGTEVGASASVPGFSDEPVSQDENPTFDWRMLPALRDGTFLKTWMDITSASYEPEEYYFFLGLEALACAVGNHVKYDADSLPLRPNLMTCLVGPTGAGKSIAMGYFKDLILEALPWESDTGNGVRYIASPGSGESLLDQFAYFLEDVVTKQPINVPINGIYRENELDTIVTLASRAGNRMRGVMMDMYDNQSAIPIQSRKYGAVTAKDHFFQVVTSTQPKSLKRLLSNADVVSGFLNRWAFITGTLKRRPAVSKFRVDVLPAVDPLQRVRAWAAAGRLIDFTPGPALDAWEQFYHEKIAPIGASYNEDDDDGMAARLPLLIKKLMLALAINDRATTIQLAHVETAKALFPYLRQVYGLVERSVEKDDMEDTIDKIRAWASAHPSLVFSPRDCQRKVKRKAETVIRALDNLVKMGELSETGVKKGRSPTYQWAEGVPQVLATVTPIRRP